MEYLFENGFSNHYLSVICLIKFWDCHDGNINGIGRDIGGNSNTIEKCNLTLDRKVKKTEYLFWLENDINDWSTASMFLFYIFVLFNRPYVKESQPFYTKHSRSIHGIYEVSNGNLAIQPTRRRKILYCLIHNPMKQHVGGDYNNINDLENGNVLQRVLATIERFLAQKRCRFTVWYKFLNVILSFQRGKLRHISNSNTGRRGKQVVGLDNCDNIGYIDTKMNGTAALTTQRTIPRSDINILFTAFVRMIFADNLIDNTFDILREWALQDQVLTLLHSKMRQLFYKS